MAESLAATDAGAVSWSDWPESVSESLARLDGDGRTAGQADVASTNRAWHGDQAAGLRRMFRARTPQVIAFASGREACGRTTLVVQTAMALAAAGHGVLVIDENQSPNNALSCFGLRSRRDLYQVLQGECSLAHALLEAAPHVQILPAARAARELGHAQRSAAAAARRLPMTLRELQQGVDFILIDAEVRNNAHLSTLALAARHMAVVVGAQGTAITHAYALIKRIVQERGRDGFQMVVTRSRTREEARAIFENMRNVARQHLDVRLDYLGAALSPATDHLAQALLQRLPPSLEQAGEGGFAWLPGHQVSAAGRTVAGDARPIGGSVNSRGMA